MAEYKQNVKITNLYWMPSLRGIFVHLFGQMGYGCIAVNVSLTFLDMDDFLIEKLGNKTSITEFSRASPS